MTPRAAALAKWRPAWRAAHAAIEAFDAARAVPRDVAGHRDTGRESFARQRLLQAARAEFCLAATTYEGALRTGAGARRPPIEEHDFYVADGRCDAATVGLRDALEDELPMNPDLPTPPSGAQKTRTCARTECGTPFQPALNKLGRPTRQVYCTPQCAYAVRLVRKRERERERYRTDPAFRERLRSQSREWFRERYRTDPVFRARTRERVRMRAWERKQRAAGREPPP